MTAIEPIKLAKNWDATRIIGEVLLTDKPSNRHYLRDLEFDPFKLQGFSDASKFSINTTPLPPPPSLESDPISTVAIKKRGKLFKIVSPINIPRFASLLKKITQTDHWLILF